MARRHATPYEIMGATGRETDGEADTDAPAAEPSEEPRGAAPAWWDAGVPVVLRLPRGYAVLLALGLLALIVLAYWVGHSRGYSAAQADREARQVQSRVDRLPSVPYLEVNPGQPAEAYGGGDQSISVGVDPRKQGMNYLILARYPRHEAERLARFLAGHGVETAVVPTHNESLFHVVGLRGFTTAQFRAGDHRDYEQRIRNLGRDWKQENNGKGQNLSDMYWDLYVP